ncbi:bifunctional DNA primase/polymerase [Streptomyces sp. NPDC057740]|uniref:bifunctional DNA primase/polymerase n=1 Tax=Streptomyces sp. NPDC057740 TaxID=3346234 RepID=UPI003695BED2
MSVFLPHALRYAARGWRVIWAPPGSKYPSMKGWPDLATTDTGIIGRWWTERPNANVCVATGQASGVWVLDVDDKDGAGGSATLAALERAHGDLPMTYAVGTGSGGVHHYWTYDGIDFRLGNSAKKLGLGLDTRGEGGQVVAPPSRVDDPAHTMPYVVLVDVAPVAAPAWLVDMLRPPAAPRPPAVSPAGTRTGPAGRLRGLLQAVLDASEGQRNDTLNWAAYRAAEMVRASEITAEQAAAALRKAAIGTGLGDSEARLTIDSALRAGGAR